MKPLLIIKCGYTDKKIQEQIGDFEDWIIEKSGFNRSGFLVVNVKNGEKCPLPESVSGVIITGSHDNITEQTPWMLELCNWLNQLPGKQIPVLGICFGHQVLAHAFGGKVGYHPKGGEYGLVSITMNKKQVPQSFFTRLPDEFYVYVSHEQTVLELPEGAISFGYNKHEPNHWVQFAPYIWGCQFHPEFYQLASDYYASESGLDINNQPQKFSEAEAIGKQILQDFAKFCYSK